MQCSIPQKKRLMNKFGQLCCLCVNYYVLLSNKSSRYSLLPIGLGGGKVG
jgi:hypothetical protein